MPRPTAGSSPSSTGPGSGWPWWPGASTTPSPSGCSTASPAGWRRSAPPSRGSSGCPGAFEIPLAAKAFAESGSVDAVIGLGCVIRGATTHYEAVAGECAAGILRAGLATGVPIIFGVLTTETLDQALERSEGPGGHNVGEEGAQTAVEMVRLLERVGR